MKFEDINFKKSPAKEKEAAMESIRKLPPELGKRWAEELAEGENPAKIKEAVEEIIAERRGLKKELFLGLAEEKIFNENFSEEERKTFNEKIKKIAEEALENKKYDLGEGRSARVVTSRIDSSACFKIIYNVEEYKKGNTVKKEVELLEKARKANKTKVRLPKPYYYKMNKSAHVYIMEKLEAITLGEALKGKKALPEKFDFETFFEELENFVKNLHQENIYHRDLLENNIMIDSETGLPCVIDFGRSTLDYSDDVNDIYRKENEVKMEKDSFPADETAILENKKNLNKFLKERNGL